MKSKQSDDIKTSAPKVKPGGEKRGYKIKESLPGLKCNEAGKSDDIMKDLGKKSGSAKVKKEIDIDKFAEKKTQRTK